MDIPPDALNYSMINYINDQLMRISRHNRDIKSISEDSSIQFVPYGVYTTSELSIIFHPSKIGNTDSILHKNRGEGMKKFALYLRKLDHIFQSTDAGIIRNIINNFTDSITKNLILQFILWCEDKKTLGGRQIAFYPVNLNYEGLKDLLNIIRKNISNDKFGYNNDMMMYGIFDVFKRLSRSSIAFDKNITGKIYMAIKYMEKYSVFKDSYEKYLVMYLEMKNTIGMGLDEKEKIYMLNRDPFTLNREPIDKKILSHIKDYEDLFNIIKYQDIKAMDKDKFSSVPSPARGDPPPPSEPSFRYEPPSEPSFRYEPTETLSPPREEPVLPPPTTTSSDFTSLLKDLGSLEGSFGEDFKKKSKYINTNYSGILKILNMEDLSSLLGSDIPGNETRIRSQLRSYIARIENHVKNISEKAESRDEINKKLELLSGNDEKIDAELKTKKLKYLHTKINKLMGGITFDSDSGVYIIFMPDDDVKKHKQNNFTYGPSVGFKYPELEETFFNVPKLTDYFISFDTTTGDKRTKFSNKIMKTLIIRKNFFDNITDSSKLKDTNAFMAQLAYENQLIDTLVALDQKGYPELIKEWKKNNAIIVGLAMFDDPKHIKTLFEPKTTPPAAKTGGSTGTELTEEEKELVKSLTDGSSTDINHIKPSLVQEKLLSDHDFYSKLTNKAIKDKILEKARSSKNPTLAAEVLAGNIKDFPKDKTRKIRGQPDKTHNLFT